MTRSSGTLLLILSPKECYSQSWLQHKFSTTRRRTKWLWFRWTQYNWTWIQRSRRWWKIWRRPIGLCVSWL